MCSIDIDRHPGCAACQVSPRHSGDLADQCACNQVDHHLCHATLAFAESPFDRALVLSYDGGGNDGTTNMYVHSINLLSVHLKLAKCASCQALASQCDLPFCRQGRSIWKHIHGHRGSNSRDVLVRGEAGSVLLRGEAGSAAIQGRGSESCDTGERQAVLRYTGEAGSAAMQGRGRQCCDTGERQEVCCDTGKRQAVLRYRGEAGRAAI